MSSTNKLYILIFALGALGVIIGAFGAHSFADRLPIKQISTFKTAVLYHFIHVLAALFVLILAEIKQSNALKWAVRFFIIGIFLFSGSLYLLSTRDLIGLASYRWLGPLTPIGGLFFITGWLRATLFFLKK